MTAVAPKVKRAETVNPWTRRAFRNTFLTSNVVAKVTAIKTQK